VWEKIRSTEVFINRKRRRAILFQQAFSMIKRLKSVSRNRDGGTQELSSIENGLLILSLIHDAIAHLINPIHQIAKRLEAVNSIADALKRIADTGQGQRAMVARRRAAHARRSTRLPRKVVKS
jgi:hypothetical protein